MRKLAVLAAVVVAVALFLGSPTTPFGRAGETSTDDYYVVIPEGQECPPTEPPGAPVVVCAPLPDGYVVPQPPDVAADQLAGYFVVFPTVIPDEGGSCPAPQDLGKDALATLCGPAPDGFRFPLPPHADTDICDRAQKELDAIKAGYSEVASPEQVAAAFPDYDPASCTAFSALGDMASVQFDALDPDLEVPPVVVPTAA